MPPKKLQGKDKLGRPRSVTRAEAGSLIYDERGRLTHVRVRKRIAGVLREKKRRIITGTLAAARVVRDELLAEFAFDAAPSVQPQHLTFNQLAGLYEREYLKPAHYIAGRKVSGLRSHAEVKNLLTPLRAHFAGREIRGITHTDISAFKTKRIGTRTFRGDVRSMSSVNGELRVLRRMLNIALQRRYLDENPFSRGDSLISAADETKRHRILTRDEEARLLALCTGRRAHLRHYIIFALDTAARYGEQLRTTWTEVDLENFVIYLPQENTKSNRPRIVPITDRLHSELLHLRARAERDLDGFDETASIFPFREIEGMWRRTLKAAGVEGFRWHDLRHTAITWMLEAGIPDKKVMKISGHSQVSTFLIYVNVNMEAAQSAAEMMNARRTKLDRDESEKSAH